MNPAPPKPPSKNADRKALAAYFSELRRWAKALGRWEASLDEREAAFERAVDQADDDAVQRYAGSFEPDRGADRGTVVEFSCGHEHAVSYPPEDECDCGDEEAATGCPCPKCSKVRMVWFAKEPAGKGDEVEWLESLWKLEDRRG